jgi:thiamine pyrophosphate-dependent acetolactate synthase large subunit-like protein
VASRAELADALAAAIADDGPALAEVIADPELV